VDHSEDRFNEIVKQYKDFAAKLEVPDIRFVPISALNGDNVVNRSENMTWYNGETLLHTLETIHIASDQDHINARFPVQTVIRPQSEGYHDYRGYAGRVAGGTFKPGDEVMVLPAGFSSKIKSIDLLNEELTEAHSPMSVTITLEDDIDISRGDMIVRPKNQPRSSQDIDVMLCWLNNTPAQPKAKYIIRHTSNEARCMIKEVVYKVDINTLHRIEDDDSIGMNDILRVKLRTTRPLFADDYNDNRNTGSIILIDEATNETVAAGMIRMKV
jgi:sulfate adenylyltransferase subunit 1